MTILTGLLVSIFQSTHPHRVRPINFLPVISYPFISIHAPAQGATQVNNPFDELSVISIHAPAQGATKSHNLCHNQNIYFNPRTRTGCDSIIFVNCFALHYFNPRTRTGCDVAVPRAPGGEGGISIHAPAQGATYCRIIDRGCRVIISIHAPAQGATPFNELVLPKTVDFNPRTRTGCDRFAEWILQA